MLQYLNPELAQQLWPLIMALITSVTFAVYVYLKAPANYKLKLLVIPLAIGLAAYTYLFVGTLVGYSYPGKLPVKFTYVAHRVLITDMGERKGLEVWSQVGQNARLYKIPYTKKMEQVLNEAAKAKGQGGTPVLEANVDGKDKGAKGAKGDSMDEYPYSLHLLLPSDVMPKQK